MAMAVQRLHPDVRCTVGPWTERGFFYDFAAPTPLADADLPAIKKEMQKIVKAKMPFVQEEVTPAEAASRIAAAGEPYKAEILDTILRRDPAAPITLYHVGEPGAAGSWWDLCAGPHVANTGDINPNALALESVAGAYWRGDEGAPMLSRVYGTAWRTKEELKAYGALKAEAAAYTAAARAHAANAERVTARAVDLLEAAELVGEVLAGARLQANGGKAPLVYAADFVAGDLRAELQRVRVEPNADAIRAALARGESVYGVAVGEAGRHLRWTP